MAKLKCPECPDFDGFAMCTSQPLSKVVVIVFIES